MAIWIWILIGIIVAWGLIGFRVIRPTQRALQETFGKYTGFRVSGLKWIWVPFQRLYYVNITERMQDVQPQEIITQDNMNAEVDLVIYYKVKDDEKDVMRSRYAVNNFQDQIVMLAKTTARNVIGSMDFKDVNNKRHELNLALRDILDKESNAWGVSIVRVELKEIRPPKDVQDSMNKIIKAENEKRAAVDFATARETEADGIRRAAIKEADGKKQAIILEAEGMARGKIVVADAEQYRIKVVYDAADKHFVDNAQALKKMEVTQASLEKNSKIILSEKGMNPTLIIGDLPTTVKKTETPKK